MTKNFAVLKNARLCRRDDIPILDIDNWRNSIVDMCKSHEGRIVSLFGNMKKGGGARLYSILGIDSKGELRIAATDVVGNAYNSITNDLVQAHLFEREIFENIGVEPTGHPWLKPVRKSSGYNYYSLEGDSIHEVAVGPVHAGVIEPGHFRFQCHGEKVFNLEIHLGYQRRGVENMMISAKPSSRRVLAESVAGDSVIANGLAYCHAVEGLGSREVTQRARVIRAISLELERIANHVGDLGAIANDVGFLPAASYFGRIRAEFLNLLLELTGNRFGRSLLRPGGVAFDIDPDMVEKFKLRITRGVSDAVDTAELMFSNPSVVARLEKTGIVTHDQAKEIGMVGVAARASGLERDARRNYPAGMYRFKEIVIAKCSSGDVFARTRVRYIEIKKSADLILELLGKMPAEKIYHPIEALDKSSVVVSIIEGWRGEIVHAAMTNENGEISFYKIVDPSFHNWTGLELALRNGQISDFPLCNKSFNLSYAGYDL